MYELKPWDPIVIATAGLRLLAMWASWVPARRAARLEPTAALRRD